MNNESFNFTIAPSYDTIYGTHEAWERLSYLTYKLETINKDMDEDIITCKVIHIIHELIRR